MLCPWTSLNWTRSQCRGEYQGRRSRGNTRSATPASRSKSTGLLVRLGSVGAARLQSGYVYTYAFIMLIGLTAALTWVIAG